MIAIIVIVAVLLFPLLRTMREGAESTKCVSNLRQIGRAFRSYALDNDGYFPAIRQLNQSRPDSDPNPNQNPTGGPWLLELAPYTGTPLAPGQENIWRLKNVPPRANAQYCPAYVRLFPSITAIQATGLSTLGYGMNVSLNVAGKDLFVPRIDVRFKEVAITRPATSILVGDSGDYHLNAQAGWQTASPTATMPDGFTSGAPKRHRGKANYLYADGHVETLTPDQALPQLQFQP